MPRFVDLWKHRSANGKSLARKVEPEHEFIAQFWRLDQHDTQHMAFSELQNKIRRLTTREEFSAFLGCLRHVDKLKLPSARNRVAQLYSDLACNQTEWCSGLCPPSISSTLYLSVSQSSQQCVCFRARA